MLRLRPIAAIGRISASTPASNRSLQVTPAAVEIAAKDVSVHKIPHSLKVFNNEYREREGLGHLYPVRGNPPPPVKCVSEAEIADGDLTTFQWIWNTLERRWMEHSFTESEKAAQTEKNEFESTFFEESESDPDTTLDGLD